jgi:aminoglycoside/choline kinase family phosphotransferase
MRGDKIGAFFDRRIIALERLERLTTWTRQVLHTLASELDGLEPASADASFRRYFRARTQTGSYIVMDAPPAQEDCHPWLHVARLFRMAGANTPEILAENLEEGFLLISDLGSTTYLAALNEDNADQLYRDANASLVKIQLASRAGELPPYDSELLMREMRLFADWYLARHLGVELNDGQHQVMEDTFQRILANNLAQPQVYVHRDWHSRNLMLTETGNPEDNPGVIDFQDAVYGPITYDLASIYKDAYIKWEEDRVLDWSVRYWEAARKAGLPVHADFGDFYRDFEWMGVQRHIKVLGIFARLCHRDGKDGYLKDMPLVMDYLRRACQRYNGLGDFLRLLDVIEGKAAEVGYTF